ncbi:MAG: hypothetical protein NZL96_03405 [Patescibacteria group bacterium]|nr:hypothetical protein [Patescibacteria group bacterium]
MERWQALISFLIGVILIISGVVGILTKNLFALVSSISALSVVYFLILKGFIRKKLVIETKNTNVSNLINKKGIITKKLLEQRPAR